MRSCRFDSNRWVLVHKVMPDLCSINSSVVLVMSFSDVSHRLKRAKAKATVGFRRSHPKDRLGFGGFCAERCNLQEKGLIYTEIEDSPEDCFQERVLYPRARAQLEPRSRCPQPHRCQRQHPATSSPLPPRSCRIFLGLVWELWGRPT